MYSVHGILRFAQDDTMIHGILRFAQDDTMIHGILRFAQDDTTAYLRFEMMYFGLPFTSS